LHFLPSPLGREYVGRYIHTYKCFIVYLHFLNILKSTRKSYLLNIFNSSSDMAKLSVSMKEFTHTYVTDHVAFGATRGN